MTVATDVATNGGTATLAANKRTGFHLWGLTPCGCVLALLLFARCAIAQNAPVTTPDTAAEAPAQTASAPPASEKTPAGPPKISYVDGQLRIDALDSTLADVLTKVAALTGVKIDVPAGANSERMPVVELGPGPARQILAALLNDSNFDYLIQASDTEPEKLQSVMLMLREKKGSGTNGTDAAARPFRSPYARAVAATVKAEEAPVPDSPVAAPPENAAAEAGSLNPQPAPTQPDQPMQLPLSQPEQSNLTKPPPLTPPQTMNPQSINQQLQQMYQQRMQMMQQDRQTGSSGAPANPGSNPAPGATVRQ